MKPQLEIFLCHNYAAMSWLNDEIKPLLETKGHTIISTWLNQTVEYTNETSAIRDIADILMCDLLIHFCDQIGYNPGRGKFIELGYALASKCAIYIVGKDCKNSVFYYLPGVKQFETFKEALETL